MARNKRKLSFTDQIEQRKRLLFVLKVVLALYFAFVFVSGMFVSNFSVSSQSMDPALSAGDRVLVSPLSYGARSIFWSGRFPGIGTPQHGDIALVEPEYYQSPGALTQIADSLVRFLTFQQFGVIGTGGKGAANAPTIKRVVGVPGDQLYMKNFEFYVKAKGSSRFLREREVADRMYDIRRDKLPPLWDDALPLSGSFASEAKPIVLGEGQYFVAGDNRAASTDSRTWGPVSVDRFVGKVVLKYWPVNELSIPQ
jgi:signal peptidase I